MINNYNNERHKYLVKRFIELKNHGKSLYHENQDEFGELLEYDGAVAEQIYLAHREEFVKII